MSVSLMEYGKLNVIAQPIQFQQKAVMQILEKYDENYQIKNNKLLIRKSLANDLDLLSNYTKKAIALSKEK